jgi:hypothetical protein
MQHKKSKIASYEPTLEALASDLGLQVSKILQHAWREEQTLERGDQTLGCLPAT